MNLYLANLQLSISATNSIAFKLLASKDYTSPLIPPLQNYRCQYTANIVPDLTNYQKTFTGEAFNEVLMPYKWEIYKKAADCMYIPPHSTPDPQGGTAKRTSSTSYCMDDPTLRALERHHKPLTAIKVSFIEHPELKEATALLNTNNKTIEVYLSTHTSAPIVIDPLFHPLGGLIMVYLVHECGGFMMHASGVADQDKGYVFSAVSGTGKSTMASLWEKAGASIINDDRLWIQKIDGQWKMFNTPMLWYSQKPAMANVNKIFLLSQSPTNQLSQLTGIKASMQVMSNCMQHFYEKEMTAKHLDRVIDFTSEIPVYDCGFKPDGEIVEEIRNG